jgi:hypothetical protein
LASTCSFLFPLATETNTASCFTFWALSCVFFHVAKAD